MNKLIKTPNGLEKYSGIRRKEYGQYYEIELFSGEKIKCSENHPFMTFSGKVFAKDLNNKHELYTESGSSFISKKKLHKTSMWLYDALNVGIENIYYTNSILSHNCEFLGSSNTLIAPSKLGAMPWKPPLQKIGDIDVYELPQPKHIYMMCVDTAEGQNLDYSAFAVIDVTECPYRLVAKYKNNQISPMMFPNIIFNVAEKYNSAHVLVETNSIGIQVAEILHTDLEYENIFSTTNLGRGGQKISAGFKKNSKLGVKTTAPMKSLGCSNLKSIVEGDKFIIQDFDTIAELTSFVATGKNYAAEPGCHDDLVMTLVMFAWLAAQPLFKELTDVDIRKQMIEGREHSLQEQLLPFGIISDGADVSKVKKTVKDKSGQNWEVVERWENNKRLWNEFDFIGDQDEIDTNDDW